VGVGLLNRDRTVAPVGYARWLIPPAALAVHLSIGQVYAFSVFKKPLVAHFDTTLTPIGWIFSIAILMLGLSAAFGGTWVERSGPRKTMFVAAMCWATGFFVSAKDSSRFATTFILSIRAKAAAARLAAASILSSSKTCCNASAICAEEALSGKIFATPVAWH